MIRLSPVVRRQNDRGWYVFVCIYLRPYSPILVSWQHIKLKEYKSKLAKAQEDLATIRSEAVGTKQRHTQWVTELQDKLSRFREEKKSWATEAVELRSKVNEATVIYLILRLVYTTYFVS